ncbi:pre-mRNA-splicing regulator WTAP-like [Macrobrachium rosenbergii]|uniref:pre-mRNA-splicing regulator WTAP-like n=1 Tax=Macrobrachium rosenbergii TaxID=79674 RepID=UPI0034D7A404
MSGDVGEEEQVSKVEASAAVTNTIAITTSSFVTGITHTTTTTTVSAPTVEPSAPSSPTTTVTTTPAPATPPPSTVTTTVNTPAPSWASPAPALVTPQDTPEEEAEEEGSVGGEANCTPERVYISPEQLANITKEELVEKWTLQEKFLECLQNRMESLEREVEELHGVRESEERLKGQLAELQRKEQYHIMRLSSKEHELQDMGAQIQELKNMSVGVGGLRNCLLDPAVNLLFERLKRDLDSARTKMEETQNELSAWKFTPDSNTGKQLMAKCRLLIKENEELGRMITSGRLAKLEGELALQRNFSEELKKSQSELDEFLLEMDEDTEGMQGTIYYLQQQLRQAKERIALLNSQLSVTQISTSQPGDDSGSQILTEEGNSELNNEMEQTEVPLVPPQPNGDATHDESQINSEAFESETSTAAAPLTNGRKRTQSEMDEGAKGAEGVGVGIGDGEGDTGEGDFATNEVDGLPPQKRTRTDGEVDQVGVGVEEESTVVENGVTESE